MLSIVIPTLNEEKYLRHTILHTLAKAKNPQQIEILVIDAGSKDQTLDSIQDLAEIKAFQKPTFALKKYESMNFGFNQASGEVILFLDADTLLPAHFDSLIIRYLQDKKAIGGAFEFAFESPDWKLQLVTLANRIRYRFGKVFYGDQAVFVRKESLAQIGGVPKEPLMETAYMCQSLSKRGKLKIVRPALKTSPRRFKTHGFFKVAWFDLNMIIRFNLGLSVSNYASIYWGKNLRSSQ
ncbi:glycosyltransferase [Ekhidna sp.]|uniref:glycosyltransferase n=1 Tax=Ekhidna sp. TaxID=2608089 RepID=UPI003B512A72